MGSSNTASRMQREPHLAGQTVVVIGGSAGIGLETARLAHTEGADIILTARNAEHLERAAHELGAQGSAAFDATDFQRLKQFFDELPTPIDHVLVTGPGPYYAPLAEFDFDKARLDIEAHLLLPLQVARHAANKIRAGGTLLFMGGTGGRRTAPGLALVSALTAAMPALTKDLALEMAPVRVNLIAAGFVDTPLSGRFSVINLISEASSSARPCRSGAWLDRLTLRHLPCTLCATRRSRVRHMTLTAGSNSSRGEGARHAIS